MIDDNPTNAVRPGLPLDPLLQLIKGSSRYLGSFAMDSATAFQIAPPSPLRVAIVCMNTGPNQFVVFGPEGPDYTLMSSSIAPFQPVSFHVRDYPGLVQGAWYAYGMLGGIVGAWEYVLND